MFYFQKLFKIPGPKDVGMSSSNNFMPIKGFANNKPTWEDYYAWVKKYHPVKYFICKTIPSACRSLYTKISEPISDAIYYIKSHVIPSKRYHMLDLRQRKNNYDIDNYRYGYVDIDSRMLYAMFNLLDEYVTKELPHCWYPSQQEIDNKDEAALDVVEFVNEVIEIYNWWHIGRKEDNKKCSDAHLEWYKAKTDGVDNAKDLLTKLDLLDKNFEDKTDEMIARLMKIRRRLWI